MTIERILGKITDAIFRDMDVDPVYLTSEQMAKGHQKISSESGHQLKISLPKGEVLEDGDVLWVENSMIVAVQAAAEDVISVESGSKLNWASAAYILGNLHKPVRFSEEAVRTPYAPESASALDEANITYHRKEEKLRGRRIRAVGAK